MNWMKVTQASQASIWLFETQMKSQIYAQREDVQVIANTPRSLIFLTPKVPSSSLSSGSSFSSLTAKIDTPEITRRLKAAEPTIVDAPSSPGHYPSPEMVSMHESKISGALEPRAIKERLAMVGFQKSTIFVYKSPFSSLYSTGIFLAVIFSIDLNLIFKFKS